MLRRLVTVGVAVVALTGATAAPAAAYVPTSPQCFRATPCPRPPILARLHVAHPVGTHAHHR